MRILKTPDLSPGELELRRTRIFIMLIDSLFLALDALPASGSSFDVCEAALYIACIKDYAAVKTVRSLPEEVAAAVAVLWRAVGLQEELVLPTPIYSFTMSAASCVH